MTQETLLNPLSHYQPFSKYQWAKDYRKKHISMHWQVEEVDHSKTNYEFYNKLTQEQQDSLIRILQFFTQADTCVSNNYIDNLMLIFKGQEVRAMLCDFANRENVHIEAYAKLIELLDFPQDRLNSFFTEYKDIQVMQDKNNFLEGYNLTNVVYKLMYGDSLSQDDKKDIVKNLASFGAFTEGLQLYSSFAFLFEPSRVENGGLLQGKSQVVEWSTKDEARHVEGILKLLKTFIEENKGIWTEDLKKELYTICGAVVHFEDAFIDYVLQPSKDGNFMTLNTDIMKRYIRYIADIRLKQLGLKPMYHIDKNPLPHMDSILSIGTGNFFEGVITDYAHGSTTGDWGKCEFE